jgi:hypothetical protein
MTISSKSKSSATTRATDLIAGLKKHFANVPSLTFASASHPMDEILKTLQLGVDLRAAVDDARNTVKAKLAAEKAQALTISSLTTGLVAFIRATFSESPDVLADFGLEPKQPATPQTAAQKAAAVVKREATRAARGTTTKAAKKAVKGAVVGVTLTPIKVAPVVEPSPAPTPPAPAGGTTGGSTSHGA